MKTAAGSSLRVVGLLVLTCLTAVATTAQTPDTFQARLSPLPVTGATVNTITGGGSVKATLRGTRLSVDGSFNGLAGPATTANLRRAPRAMPGPIVYELTVPTERSGRLTATLDLTAADVADLRAGRLYVQIHSERAPDGSIRGWLLP